MFIMKRFSKIIVLLLALLMVIAAAPVYAEETQGPVTLSKTATVVEGSPRHFDIQLTVTGDKVPVDVVLVIDRSLNMTGRPMEATKTAAKGFADTLLTDVPGSRIAVVSYAGAPSDGSILGFPYWNSVPGFEKSTTDQTGGFKENVGEIKTAIDNIAVNQLGTDIRSGFQKAADIIINSDHQERVKAIVLMSNGTANMGDWYKQRILGKDYYFLSLWTIWENPHADRAVGAAQSAKSGGAYVFTVGLKSLESIILDEDTLEDAADPGCYYSANLGNIDDKYDQIATDITNLANAVGANAVVTDIVSEEFEVVDGSFVASQGSSIYVINPDGTTTITWTIGDIETGDATLNYRIKAKDGVASETENDLIETNDEAYLVYDEQEEPEYFDVPSVYVPQVDTPGIMIDKSGPDAAKAGETITYYFTITNTGGVPLYNIVVCDAMLDEVDGIIYELSYLGVEQSAYFNVDYTIPSDYTEKTLENTATVTADLEEGEVQPR